MGSTRPDTHGHKLTFVNVSDPFEVSAGLRRLVRSRATAYSHRDPDRRPKKRIPSDRPSRPAASHQQVKRSRREEVAATVQNGVALRQTVDHEYLAQANNERSKSQRLEMLSLDGGNTDPFDALPVAAEPWHAWVLDYYRTCHLPAGLALIQRSPAEGQYYVDWHLRLSLEEPAFFYMQLLNACARLTADGRVPEAVVIRVRGQLVASLNEAIGDPRRVSSIPTLLTVASIALYERLYGDPVVAIEVHGRAFHRMLEMRGGLRSLEGTPRLLLYLLQWTDSVLSADAAPSGQLLSAWAPAAAASTDIGSSQTFTKPEFMSEPPGPDVAASSSRSQVLGEYQKLDDSSHTMR